MTTGLTFRQLKFEENMMPAFLRPLSMFSSALEEDEAI